MLPPWGGRTRELPARKLSARKLLLSAVDSDHDSCRLGSGSTSVGPHRRGHQSASTAEQPRATFIVLRLHGADTLDFSDAWQHHVGLISSLKEMHHTGPHTPAMLCFITHENL